jgi:two-component sensor histidine kinase
MPGALKGGKVNRIPVIRRLILADRAPLAALGWSVLAVAVPTLLRWAIDRGTTGNPFITFYPAVLLAALLLGWRWAAGVALASAFVANRLLQPTPYVLALAPRDAMLLALFAFSCAALIWTGEMCRRLVRELEQAKEREEMLNHELGHRVKNMLATVSAMAVLTARHSAPEDLPQALGGRMDALKRATDLLTEHGDGAQCNVRRLVEQALAPFRDDRNFALDGPGCELPRDACVPLSLALHELCTNAAKYGALSVPQGQVTVLWTVGEGEDGLLRLVWREDGGPPVCKPTRAGMGSKLLRRQRGLRRVEVDFKPAGLTCDIEVDGVRAA